VQQGSYVVEGTIVSLTGTIADYNILGTYNSGGA
jgi:hypothetical protein